MTAGKKKTAAPKTAPKTEKKPECEVKTLFCSGQVVRKWTGVEKGDPVFWCCLACLAKLRRQGLRIRPA